VTEQQVVREPRTVAKWVATESVRLTPRVVAMRVPVDGCGQPIETYYMPSEGTTTQRVIVEPAPSNVTPPPPPMNNGARSSTDSGAREPADERPMLEQRQRPMTNGTEREPSDEEAPRRDQNEPMAEPMEDEAPANGGSVLKKEPDTKVVPRTPSEEDDKNGLDLNTPKRARREPTPASGDAQA